MTKGLRRKLCGCVMKECIAYLGVDASPTALDPAQTLEARQDSLPGMPETGGTGMVGEEGRSKL